MPGASPVAKQNQKIAADAAKAKTLYILYILNIKMK